MHTTLTSNELANELRTGELLCHLIRSIVPDALDPDKLNANAETSETLSVFNINLFLNACRLYVSDLDEKFFFDAEILFNFVDLRPEVLEFLSQLSKSKVFKSKLNGFNLVQIKNEKPRSNNEEDDENQYYSTNLDIYNVYAPTRFFLSSNDYNEITEAFKLSNKRSKGNMFQAVRIKSTEYVLRELIVTEESYIHTLEFLSENFIVPSARVLTYENYKRITINIETILKFHQFFYAELVRVCSGGAGKLYFFYCY